jgi:hypothetical protein
MLSRRAQSLADFALITPASCSIPPSSPLSTSANALQHPTSASYLHPHQHSRTTRPAHLTFPQSHCSPLIPSKSNTRQKHGRLLECSTLCTPRPRTGRSFQTQRWCRAPSPGASWPLRGRGRRDPHRRLELANGPSLVVRLVSSCVVLSARRACLPETSGSFCVPPPGAIHASRGRGRRPRWRHRSQVPARDGATLAEEAAPLLG